MSKELLILAVTAASIGFIHTAACPNHYIPFIAIAKAKGWSLLKTLWVTFLCGSGHIAGFVLLGLIGGVFGIAIPWVNAIEAFCGEIAAWGLILFGLFYFIWGLKKVYKPSFHRRLYVKANNGEHIHFEDIKNEKKDITPWILFTIFVFGSCESLIPLVMYPMVKNNLLGIIIVVSVYGIISILTMMTIVAVSLLGINLLPKGRFEKFSYNLAGITKYSHALAGVVIFFCGISVKFFGL